MRRRRVREGDTDMVLSVQPQYNIENHFEQNILSKGWRPPVKGNRLGTTGLYTGMIDGSFCMRRPSSIHCGDRLVIRLFQHPQVPPPNALYLHRST